jgi:hypothetical protein
MYNCRHNYSKLSSGTGGPSDSSSYMVSSFHYSPSYSAYRTQNATGAESGPGLRSTLYSVARLGLASVTGCRLDRRRGRGKDEREEKSRDQGAREIGEVGRDNVDSGSTKQSPRERTHRKYIRKFQKKLTEFTGLSCLDS